MSKFNWCNQHPNLTFLLTLAGTLIILFVVDIPIILSEADNAEVMLLLVNLPVFLLSVLTISIWILRRKRRRLWWLLMLFIPYGWIIYLLLENRRQPAKPLEL
jgi:hypothetical protein